MAYLIVNLLTDSNDIDHSLIGMTAMLLNGNQDTIFEGQCRPIAKTRGTDILARLGYTRRDIMEFDLPEKTISAFAQWVREVSSDLPIFVPADYESLAALPMLNKCFARYGIVNPFHFCAALKWHAPRLPLPPQKWEMYFFPKTEPHRFDCVKHVKNVAVQFEEKRKKTDIDSLLELSFSDPFSTDRLLTETDWQMIRQVESGLAFNFSNVEITDSDITKLGEISAPSAVMICFSSITDKAVENLAKIPSLRKLSLCHCLNISDSGIELLTSLDQLESLDLTGCTSLTDKSLKYLTQIPCLRELNLSECKISDEGLKTLAGFTHLESVDLGDCPHISDFGLDELMSLSQLADIYITPGPNITRYTSKTQER